MKIAYILVLFIALFSISGCAFQRPAPDTDYGTLPPNYKELVKEKFRHVLKDPSSARYEFHAARKAYGNNGLVYGGDVVWVGWAVPIEINAKNSFGGYTGFQPWLACFSHGEVVAYYKGWQPVLVTFIQD